MVHTYLIDGDGGIYAKADDTQGVTLEIDMHHGDNLPAHVIPCPERGERPVFEWGQA